MVSRIDWARLMPLMLLREVRHREVYKPACVRQDAAGDPRDRWSTGHPGTVALSQTEARRMSRNLNLMAGDLLAETQTSTSSFGGYSQAARGRCRSGHVRT